MHRYSFLIGCMAASFLIFAHDSNSLIPMQFDYEDIRSMSNIIAGQALTPIWIEDLVHDNVRDDSGKHVYTGDKDTWPENDQSTNSMQTLKFFKEGEKLSVIELKTGKTISSGEVTGSFKVHWEEEGEVVSVLTDTPELIKCRFSYDSILQRLSKEQLEFIRSCLTEWEQKKRVCIGSESSYALYCTLPQELQHTQLYTLTSEMSRQKRWDAIAAPFKTVVSYCSIGR